MNITKNTKIRVLSAIILMLSCMMVLSLGKKAVMLSMFILNAVVLDEILKYFLKFTREDFSYWINITIFCFISVVLYQIKNFNFLSWSEIIIYVSVFLQFALLGGMFFKFKWEKKNIFQNPFFWCINLSLTFLCFVILIHEETWVRDFTLFILISIVADSMAWVVGKKLGKTKLYPEVSPNKTLEGALGGWFFAASLILFYFAMVMNYGISLKTLIIACMLPVLSITGDLTQSYFKRMVHLKDSSQRIPGHGGFYDRLDSHLFLVSFYLFFTKILMNM